MRAVSARHLHPAELGGQNRRNRPEARSLPGEGLGTLSAGGVQHAVGGRKRDSAQQPQVSAELEKRGVEIIIPSKELVAKARAMRREFIKEGRIVGSKCVSANDLLIILIADELGMTVVTDEAPGKGNFNIPSACEHLDVPYMNSTDLLAKHGF